VQTKIPPEGGTVNRASGCLQRQLRRKGEGKEAEQKKRDTTLVEMTEHIVLLCSFLSSASAHVAAQAHRSSRCSEKPLLLKRFGEPIESKRPK
jgi:hypothetical protein